MLDTSEGAIACHTYCNAGDPFIRLTVTSYKDHFEQRPLRTRETSSYKSKGVTSNKDFLYEVVPEVLHTRAEELYIFHTKTISYKNPRVNFLFEFLD